jgi:hypothetical protein
VNLSRRGDPNNKEFRLSAWHPRPGRQLQELLEINEVEENSRLSLTTSSTPFYPYRTR